MTCHVFTFMNAMLKLRFWLTTDNCIEARQKGKESQWGAEEESQAQQSSDFNNRSFQHQFTVQLGRF